MGSFEDLFKEKNEALLKNYSLRGLGSKLLLLKTVEKVKKDPDYHDICWYHDAAEFYHKGNTTFCDTCKFLSENYDNLKIEKEITKLEKDYFKKYKEGFKING